MSKPLLYFMFLGNLFLPFIASSQIPTNDLYLFDLLLTDSIELSNPQNITNREGYDSQPAFLLDGSAILYSSIRDDGQADVYRYNLASKVIDKITNTDNGHEYSPTPILLQFGLKRIVLRNVFGNLV